MNWREALQVFIAMVALDFIWARYTIASTSRQPIMAGLYAVGITLLGAFATISYVADHALMIPAAAGAFIGTAVAVWKV